MSLKVIYDRYHQNIEISDLEVQVLKNPLINRLHSILQNSTAYKVFPCCQTTRFEHSLGTMHLSSMILNNGLLNSIESEDYVSEKSDVIRNIIKSSPEDFFRDVTEKHSLKSIEVLNEFLSEYQLKELSEIIDKEEFYDSVIEFIGKDFIHRNVFKDFDKSDKNYFAKRTTILLLNQALRLMGLFHDIGHLPFSHLFEFSVDNVRNKLADKKNRNELEEKVFSQLNDYLNISKVKDQTHERVGRELSKHIFFELSYNCSVDRNTKTWMSKVFIIILLFKIWEEVQKDRSSRLYSLYNIISGVIDADRMDFIQRDGSCSGIAKTTGNIDRIIKMACVKKVVASYRIDDFIFSPSLQTLHDIENLLYDRFKIYKYLVNHHAVKRSDYILQKLIEIKLEKELENNISADDLFEAKNLVSCIEFITRLSDPRDQHFGIAQLKFTQLTDYWLLAILNKDFISYMSGALKGDELYFTLLEEFFHNRRGIKSLWKRTHNYNSFLINLGDSIIDNWPFKKEELNFNKQIDSKKEFIEFVDLLENDQDFQKIGARAIDFIRISHPEVWAQKIEKELDGILITPVKLKSGISKLTVIDYKNQGKDPFDLNEVSYIEEMLSKDCEQTTKFFVYFCNNLSEGEVLNKTINSIRNLLINIIKKDFLILKKKKDV